MSGSPWSTISYKSKIAISQFLSCGIWPAVPLTGYWLLPPRHLLVSSGSVPPFTPFSIWVMVGLMVWSVGMILAAAARVYRANYFGLAGWVVVLASLVAFLNRGAFVACPTIIWTLWDVTFLAGMGLAGLLYLGFPRESIAEVSDMGVYANHGIFIAQHGRLDIDYPWRALGQELSDEFHKHSPHKSNFFANHVFPGFQKNGAKLVAEFGHIWPVWLAQAYATGGPGGLFRLNGVAALLALGSFHGLCLMVVPSDLSVIATLFLAMLASQVWIARTTLSEVSTQFAICTGALLLLAALRSGTSSLALWAGAAFSFAALIRCDSLLLLFLVIIGQLVHSTCGLASDQSDKTWLFFHLAALPGCLLSIGYFIAFSRPYFWKQFVYLRLIAIGTVVAYAGLLFLPRLLTPDFGHRLNVLFIADIVGGAVVLLASYAYWIRPRVVHYKLDWPDHPLHGEPHRAEYSLRDLGRYVSPVVLAAAMVGWWLALRGALIPENSWLLPWLMIFAGYAILYLYDPCDDPVHFWRIRRYVPVIIPGFIFFAAIACDRGLTFFPSSWRSAVLALVFVSLIGFNVRKGMAFWWRREDPDSWDQIKNLAQLVSTDTIIFAAGQSEWITPLYIAFDRCVVPIDLDRDLGWELLARGVDEQLRRGRTPYLLYDNGRVFASQPQEIGRASIHRQFIEPTIFPVPRCFKEVRTTVVLAAIREPLEPPSIDLVAIGGSKVWGVEESGFYQEVRGSHQQVRWTNGHGKLIVTIGDAHRPETLMIDLAATAPAGSSLRITVNNHEVNNVSMVEGGRYFEMLSLANVPSRQKWTIELISSTFVPAESPTASSDTRKLGVLVREIRLL